MSLAPNLARRIVVVVFSGFFLIALLRVLYRVDLALVLLCALYTIPLLWLQLYVFSRPQARISRATLYIALLAQTLVVYLPLLQFPEWVAMPGFLAGSVLLVLPPGPAWAAFSSIVLSMAVHAYLTGGPTDVAYVAVSTTITGLVVYGLTKLQSLVVELHDTRTELAQTAVAQERLRFSRDLHDLLGHSLSAITLKSELTRRLVTRNPDQAQDELVEILDISRKALVEVRSVASGYRELSLRNESESARSLLLAANVDVTIHMNHGDLPTPVKTALAMVLREGITNVLRHSNAKRCDISMRQTDGRVWLDIVNDGVQSNRAQPDGGSGIGNLSARMAALHGQLVAGVEPDGRYGLHASAPTESVKTEYDDSPVS
jgi:two-component system, NarL family, sensor histidine kinase DesK